MNTAEDPLQAFCNRIMRMNKIFEPLGFMGRDARMESFMDLRRNTALFARAYQAGGPDAEIQACAETVRGSLLACESMQVLSTREVEALLDQLDALLDK